jgi:mitochondrial ATPase complex subunit ATP10
MHRAPHLLNSIRQSVRAVECQSQRTSIAIAGPSRYESFAVRSELRSTLRPFHSSQQQREGQKDSTVNKATPNESEKVLPETTKETQTETSKPVREPLKSSYAPQSSSEFAEQGQKPLPFLSAPLGVSQKPSSKKLTWTEKRERQFDNNLRMERRKAIVKEATRGYFHDVHAMRSHGGKTWIAPSTLIRQDRALFFPAISGTSLSESRQKRNTADFLPGKVSIVAILTSQVSEAHVKSFYEQTHLMYRDDPNYQLVQINLQENVLKAALVSLFQSSLRKQIPQSLQSTYLFTTQDLTVEKEAIALHNKHVGYVYLVGPDGKIRWAGGGFAEHREQQALVACTGVLLSRIAEGKA